MIIGAKKPQSSSPVVQPPPYNNGIYPAISGTVEIKGEVKLDKEKDAACGTQREIDPKMHMDCYKGIRDIFLEWDSDNDEGVDRDPQSKGSYIERHREGRRSGEVRHRRGVERSRGGGSQECALDGEGAGKERERREAWPTDSHNSTHSPLALELLEDLRDKMKKKANKTPAGVHPIQIKGVQAYYTPWASQDLEGLVLRLPNINEGASKWIRTFEEHTVGKLLAVGDLKALLARVVGISKMESILDNGELHELLDKAADGITFDSYRTSIWSLLRTEYPTRVDPRSLKGHTMGDTENPASYLQKQVVRWRMETEKDPEGDPLISVIFRASIIETLPISIRNKLEDVVGLTSSLSHKEFSDHLVHAVDRYRQNELKIQEQSREVQRKLTQLQWEELTRKDKDKKKQAAVLEANTMTPVLQQAPPQQSFFQTPPETTTFPAQQPQSLRSPEAPVVNVYTQNSGNPNNRSRQNQYRGTQGQFRYNQQQEQQGQRGEPLRCWGCNQEGHIRRNCRTTFNPTRQQGQQGQGQQQQQGNHQGQQGPWMGQGY